MRDSGQGSSQSVSCFEFFCDDDFLNKRLFQNVDESSLASTEDLQLSK